MKRAIDKEYFRKMGRYFGYPECCIEAFCNDLSSYLETRTPEQDKVSYAKRGFVPCHSHAVQILSGKITMESLIKNRKCSTPFPVAEQEEIITVIQSIKNKVV